MEVVIPPAAGSKLDGTHGFGVEAGWNHRVELVIPPMPDRGQSVKTGWIHVFGIQPGWNHRPEVVIPPRGGSPGGGSDSTRAGSKLRGNTYLA